MDIRLIKNSFNVMNHPSWFWDNVENNTWEPDTYRFIDRFITKDMVCMDIGAWIGPIALYLNTKCKKTYAIEPDPVAYEQLLFHLRLNPIGNFITVMCAIGNVCEEIVLGNPVDLGDSMTRRYQTKNNFTVMCHTLLDFYMRIGMTQIDFIKIDVEGMEEDIVEDLKFFKRFKPILYISLHPFWFKDKEKGMEKIEKLTGMYAYMYNEKLEQLHSVVGNTIILADKELSW